MWPARCPATLRQLFARQLNWVINAQNWKSNERTDRDTERQGDRPTDGQRDETIDMARDSGKPRKRKQSHTARATWSEIVCQAFSEATCRRAPPACLSVSSLCLSVYLIRVKSYTLSAAYMQLIGGNVAQWCVNQRSNPARRQFERKVFFFAFRLIIHFLCELIKIWYVSQLNAILLGVHKFEHIRTHSRHLSIIHYYSQFGHALSVIYATRTP